MIETICLDLDGTILTNKKVISEETKQKLIEFQEGGGKLVLASGRTFSRMYEYALALKMDQYHGYIIESNGTGIYACDTKEHLFERRLTFKEASEIFDYLKTYDIEILIMGAVDLYIYLPKGVTQSKFIEKTDMEGLRNRKIHIISNIEEIEEPLNKLCISSSEAIVDEIYQHLKGNEPTFWFGKVLPTWIEFCPLDTSKGLALEKVLRDYLHKPLETCAAFGDGENDISMLAKVGYGVAMGNALDSVKKACQYTSDTNENNGIAKFLNEMEELS